MYDALGLRVRGFAGLELSKPRNFVNPIEIQDAQCFGFMCLGLGFSCRITRITRKFGTRYLTKVNDLLRSRFFSHCYYWY